MAKFRFSTGRMAATATAAPAANASDLAGLRSNPDRKASNRAFMVRFVRRYRETLRALSQR